MIEAEKNIRKYVKVLNDGLHGRTFMNYEQFCEAVDQDIDNSDVFQFRDGYFMPAKHVLIMDVSRKNLVNYYPEYIKALFND